MEKVVKIPTQLNYNVDLIMDFFEDRGVHLDSLDKLPAMTTGTRYFHGEQKQAVGFIYGPRENPTAIKWRSVDGKAFSCDGAPKSFYGIENVDEEDQDLTIVEGSVMLLLSPASELEPCHAQMGHRPRLVIIGYLQRRIINFPTSGRSVTGWSGVRRLCLPPTMIRLVRRWQRK